MYIVTADHDGIIHIQDGLDLSNFSTCDNDNGDIMENEGYREEEIEMSEKNTMSLLVSTDGRSQL